MLALCRCAKILVMDQGARRHRRCASLMRSGAASAPVGIWMWPMSARSTQCCSLKPSPASPRDAGRLWPRSGACRRGADGGPRGANPRNRAHDPAALGFISSSARQARPSAALRISQTIPLRTRDRSGRVFQEEQRRLISGLTSCDSPRTRTQSSSIAAALNLSFTSKADARSEHARAAGLGARTCVNGPKKG